MAIEEAPSSALLSFSSYLTSWLPSASADEPKQDKDDDEGPAAASVSSKDAVPPPTGDKREDNTPAETEEDKDNPAEESGGAEEEEESSGGGDADEEEEEEPEDVSCTDHALRRSHTDCHDLGISCYPRKYASMKRHIEKASRLISGRTSQSAQTRESALT